MRFRTTRDVRVWTGVLAGWMPVLLERMESLTATEMYLGKDLQW